MAIWGKLNNEQKKVVLLSSLGGMLEFYDFTIYGLFSVYFAHQFFPKFDNFAAVIASYSIFVVGYIARPIGGVVFSHIGDEIGRKTVLILTMILMGASALGMGLLPTYSQIGIWAPILMLALRILQGIAIGGELPSTIVYVTESIPSQKSIAMGIVFAGTLCGLLPAMLINIYITHYLTEQQLNDFGWRIPFILGGILCFIAYQVRRKLHETTAFTNLQQHNRFPFAELIQHHFGKVIIGVGLVSIMATPILLLILFMPTYLTKILKFPTHSVSNVILFTTVISVIFTYLSGLISTKFSPYKLMQICTILIAFAAAICYIMIAYNKNLFIALSIFAVFQGLLVSIPPVLLSTLFPVHIRLTGVALSYNLSFIFFGGLTPIVITTIIKHTGLLYTAPIICMIFTSIITLLALVYYRKNIPRLK